MKHYHINTLMDGHVEFSSFWADDEAHAIEQFEDESTEFDAASYITHIFVSNTEILNSAIA